MTKMEVKTSLLDNMVGVGDMVLLEPLTEDSFIQNLKNRFDRDEIYVSFFFCLSFYTDNRLSVACQDFPVGFILNYYFLKFFFQCLIFLHKTLIYAQL